jgi:hypothetical protein
LNRLKNVATTILVVIWLVYAWNLPTDPANPAAVLQIGSCYILLKPVLVWSLAVLVIYLILRLRFTLWNLMASIRIWMVLNDAKKKLRAINRGDIADGLKWDEKWFGD